MPSPPPQPSPRPRSRSASGQLDRRTIIASAALLTVAICGGIIWVAATADSGPRRDTQGQQQEDGGDKPHIIDRPNSGHAPTNPGDRGGWEQLSLLGLIVAAIVGLAVVVFRGGSRARAGRAAWKDAAASGRDGAVP